MIQKARLAFTHSFPLISLSLTWNLIATKTKNWPKGKRNISTYFQAQTETQP